MKKDCKNVETLMEEVKRMCDSYPVDCDGCELCDADMCLNAVNDGFPEVRFPSLQEVAEIVQKWSDEHPEYTRADKFYEIFPNAPKSKDGTPNVCLHTLGWGKDDDCPNISCFACWRGAYKEVEE